MTTRSSFYLIIYTDSPETFLMTLRSRLSQPKQGEKTDLREGYNGTKEEDFGHNTKEKIRDGLSLG